MNRFFLTSGPIVATLIWALPTLALASVQPNCVVKDAGGNALHAQTSTQMTGGVFTLTGSGDSFSFRVDVTGNSAKLELVDTRSGDKATLNEGDLAIGEEVALGLVTNEAPTAGLSLVCTGVEQETAAKSDSKVYCGQFYNWQTCQSYGCRWDNSENRCEDASIGPTPNCSAFHTPSGCYSAPGCQWTGNICTGGAYVNCYSLSYAPQQCMYTFGCRWDSVENQCEPSK